LMVAVDLGPESWINVAGLSVKTPRAEEIEPQRHRDIEKTKTEKRKGVAREQTISCLFPSYCFSAFVFSVSLYYYSMDSSLTSKILPAAMLKGTNRQNRVTASRRTMRRIPTTPKARRGCIPQPRVAQRTLGCYDGQKTVFTPKGLYRGKQVN